MTPKLLQKPDADLKQELKEILETYRSYKNNVEGAINLLDFDLAKIPPIEKSWLSHEVPVLTLEKRLQAVEVFLHLLVGKLRPNADAEPDYHVVNWRRYSSLYHYYLLGETAEATTFRWESNASQRTDYSEPALDELTKVLRVLLCSPTIVEEQRLWLVEFLYNTLSLSLQKILICLTILKAPLSERILPKFLHDMNLKPVEKKWLEILYESRLIYKNGRDDVCLHNETLQYLHLKAHMERILPLQVHRWGEKHFRNQGDFLLAALHLFGAQDYPKAIQTLEGHYDSIVGAGLAKDFMDLVRAIQGIRDLENNLQACLWFLRGRLILLHGEKEAALDYFIRASRSSISEVRVRAFWQAAKLAEDIQPAMATIYYELAYKEAQDEFHDYEMLFLILVDWAWLLMEQQPNIEQAESNLNNAEVILEAHFPKNRERLSQLYDALARLQEHYEGRDLGKYIQLTRKSYIFAKVSGSKERLIHACINLGMGLAHGNAPKEGLTYAKKGLVLSKELGNQETAARSYKILGACHYFLLDYERAIGYYHQALDLLRSVEKPDEGKSGWLALTHADLAEALAMVAQKETARFHYFKAKEINETLHDKGVENFIKEIEERFPWLDVDLDDKSWLVYGVIEKLGRASVGNIENYLQANEESVPRRTINNKLASLLNQGLIKHNGKKGPASAYYL